MVLKVPGSLTCGELLPRGLGQLESRALVEMAPVMAGGRTGPGVFREDETVREMVGRVNPHADRVRPQDCDDTVLIGRYFAFCRPPVRPGLAPDRDFLRHVGVPALPAIHPRLGVGALGSSELDLHLHPFGRENPPFLPLAVASGARLVYRVGEVVTVFALCLSPAGAAGASPATMHLALGGETVPGSERPLQLVGGLAATRWEGLPEGQYTAVLRWQKEEARIRFTVGRYHRAPAHGRWLDGPRQDQGAWVGTVALSVHEAPLAPGVTVEVEMEVDDGSRPASRRTMTRGEGCVDIRVPVTHPECRVMRFSWEGEGLQAVQLALPGGEVWDGGGMRAAAAPGNRTTPAACLHVSVPAGDDLPLRMGLGAGERAVLVAERDIAVAAITIILPETEAWTLDFQDLRRDQAVEFPVFGKKKPAAHGFLCMGALCDDGRGDLQVHERALPFFRPTRLEVSCVVAPVVEAGTKTRLEIRTMGESRAAVAVVVQDARHHAAGGLSATAASRRLEGLREETKRLEGSEPASFSESYLDGLFRLKGGWKAQVAMALVETAEAWERLKEAMEALTASRPVLSPGSGHIRVDLLPAQRSGPDLVQGLATLGAQWFKHVTESTHRRDAEGNLPSRVFSLPASSSEGEIHERAETVFAGVVETRRGRAEVILDVPAAPGSFSVELVAVDPVGLGLATARGAFESRRPIQVRTDAVPTCVHPLDADRVAGRVTLQSSKGEPTLEILRDGKEIRWTRGHGGQDIHFPVEPGVYTFSAHAGGEAFADRVEVRRTDRIREHVRRVVVLRPGERFDIGSGDRVYDLRFAQDPDEMFGSCGRALAQYEHKCCEQTAAALLGAWLALVTSPNGMRSELLGSLQQGLRRMESMWRRDGFAAYPNQPGATPFWGEGAYRHLCEVDPLRRVLGGRGCDAAEVEVAGRLHELVVKAEKVYGPPLKGAPKTCQMAWLGLEREPDAAVMCVLDRGWQVRTGATGSYGCVETRQGHAVMNRSETCYGAAVLLSSARERPARIPELLGTAGWIGGQMRQGGRLYSTVDSAALMAFLACARHYSLFAGQGRVRIDGGAPQSCAEGAEILRNRVPRIIECVEGQVRMFVDAVVERSVEANAGQMRVRLETGGRECSSAALGSRVELVVDVGVYEPGMLLHVTLPPCLAREEGGVRLQSFQRDFEGASLLRSGLVAIERTCGGPWHGTVVLQDMFHEESMSAQTVAFEVT